MGTLENLPREQGVKQTSVAQHQALHDELTPTTRTTRESMSIEQAEQFVTF